MTETSAEVDQSAAPAGEYISLLRIKSSDNELRTLLLAVFTDSMNFLSNVLHMASQNFQIYVILFG